MERRRSDERTKPTCPEVVARLKACADREHLCGMARFGIDTTTALGIRVVDLRRLAREIGRDHALALELYRLPIHEGRILASMLADPLLFSEEEMDRWVGEFRSWDLCDQCCMNLFRHTPYAYRKVGQYAASSEEFTRRAGFALLATLAAGDKRADEERFRACLPLIERYAREDSRDRVRKAVNWALRAVGKRGGELLPEALAVARRLADDGAFPAARWIGRDAVRELTDPKTVARIGRMRSRRAPR